MFYFYRLFLSSQINFCWALIFINRCESIFDEFDDVINYGFYCNLCIVKRKRSKNKINSFWIFWKLIDFWLHFFGFKTKFGSFKFKTKNRHGFCQKETRRFIYKIVVVISNSVRGNGFKGTMSIGRKSWDTLPTKFR